MEKLKNNDPKTILIVSTVILLFSAIIFFRVTLPNKNNVSRNKNNNLTLQEPLNAGIDEGKNETYDGLIKKLGSIEELERKQLEEFLNNRANRIATKEFLENTLKKKDGIIQVIKEKYLEEYKKDYIIIDGSLNFTKEALEAFNGKNAITDIKFLLLNKTEM